MPENEAEAYSLLFRVTIPKVLTRPQVARVRTRERDRVYARLSLTFHSVYSDPHCDVRPSSV
jgi:hypothetical protein